MTIKNPANLKRPSSIISDDRGATAVVFAVSCLILVGIIGMSLDYGRATRAKSRLAAAADAAALAAARTAADLALSNPDWSASQIAAQAQTLGRNLMQTNIKEKNEASLGNLDLLVEKRDAAWTSTLSYTAQITTTASTALGLNFIDVGGKATASVGQAFPVLDIAMCVDSTGSMTPTLDAVKTNASAFFDNLNAEFQKRKLPPFPLVRVKMIYFKDYGDIYPNVWDPDPINESNFYSLPAEASDFSAFVSPQVAYGGSDTPESGLECLNKAMTSAWTKVGDVPPGFSQQATDVYPLIVIWTDAPSHPLPFPNSLANPNYPPASDMPRTFAELRAKWDSSSTIDQTHKQILFFGDPDITSADQSGYDSGWLTVKTWPRFTVGGTLTEANTSMIEFLATGIATGANSLRITQ